MYIQFTSCVRRVVVNRKSPKRVQNGGSIPSEVFLKTGVLKILGNSEEFIFIKAVD